MGILANASNIENLYKFQLENTMKLFYLAFVAPFVHRLEFHHLILIKKLQFKKKYKILRVYSQKLL